MTKAADLRSKQTAVEAKVLASLTDNGWLMTKHYLGGVGTQYGAIPFDSFMMKYHDETLDRWFQFVWYVNDDFKINSTSMFASREGGKRQHSSSIYAGEVYVDATVKHPRTTNHTPSSFADAIEATWSAAPKFL